MQTSIQNCLFVGQPGPALSLHANQVDVEEQRDCCFHAVQSPACVESLAESQRTVFGQEGLLYQNHSRRPLSGLDPRVSSLDAMYSTNKVLRRLWLSHWIGQIRSPRPT